MSWLREVAKFVCGAEAFHAFVHCYFWWSGTTISVFGIVAETPTMHFWGAIINAFIGALLGVYAWRRPTI